MVKLILLGIIYAVVTAICFVKIKQIGNSIRFEDTIKNSIIFSGISIYISISNTKFMIIILFNRFSNSFTY